MLASDGVLSRTDAYIDDENHGVVPVPAHAARNEPTSRARVLDLYAGTGALAFEALSRGMTSAVLVEQGREAASIIRENARALEAESRVQLLVGRVERMLSQVKSSFELILVDPPYAEVKSPAFVDVLERAAQLLAPSGVLVLEHATPDAPPEQPSLTRERSRTYGDTTLTFYRPA